MGLRKSIVFVGSVLVLAACDRAGSPTGPMSLHEGAAASAKKKDTTGSTTMTMSGSCVWIRGGESDSTMVCDEAY